MPYLQVDLDGKRHWPMVAAGCGIHEAFVAKGFLDLWEMCWRERTATVGVLRLECLFLGAKGERIAEVLCAYGFLEPISMGLFRVRGADKYLRIADARKEGGRKGGTATAKGGKSLRNLKNAPEKPLEAPRSPLEAQACIAPKPAPSKPPSSLEALTPSTEHRAPKLLPSEVVAAPSAETDSIEFFGWTQDAAEVALPGRFPELPPPEYAEWYPRASGAVGSPERLAGAWLAWVKDPWAKSRTPALSIRAFIARDKWREFVPPERKSA